MNRLQQSVYGLILVLYLLLGGLFAWRTPAWQSPDEPAHHNYIAQVAAGMLLPVIQEGDWDNDYLETLKSARFAPDLLDRLDTIRYENHQPPLYYWLSAPVYLLTNGSLFALRLFSVLIGAITVLLAYRVALAIFPQRHELALATMAFVAFLPQHVAILASVNNDSLAFAVLALLLLQTVRYLKNEAVPVWQLGLLIGVAIITKTTVYFMGGVVLLAIFLCWAAEINNQREAENVGTQPAVSTTKLLKNMAMFALAIAPFALFWFGRNISVYGFPDIMGLRAHDAVVIGQTRTADYIADIGRDAYLQQAWQTSYNSFRGQFGWMAVPMDAGIYLLLDILLFVALSGVALYLLLPRLRFQQLRNPAKRNIAIVNVVMLLLIMLMYVFYNTTFVQFQGRYLFGAMIPLGMTLAMGLVTWQRFLLAKVEWARYLPVAAFAGLFLLDVYLIWRVIPGALSP